MLYQDMKLTIFTKIKLKLFTLHIYFKTLIKLSCFVQTCCSRIYSKREAKECSSMSSIVQRICGWMGKKWMDRRIDGWKCGGLTVCSIKLRGSKWVSRIRTGPALCQDLFNLGQASYRHLTLTTDPDITE